MRRRPPHHEISQDAPVHQSQQIEEDAMNAKLIADSQSLRQAAERLERVGLIVDRAALSREHRLAYFALQCHSVVAVAQREPQRPKIGFAYPNAR
jgi:hypothetical protein